MKKFSLRKRIFFFLSTKAKKFNWNVAVSNQPPQKYISDMIVSMNVCMCVCSKKNEYMGYIFADKYEEILLYIMKINKWESWERTKKKIK